MPLTVVKDIWSSSFHYELSPILSQGPRIDFQSEGAKIVLLLISPGGPFIVDGGRENFEF